MDVLRRSTAGLVFRDQFTRADGGPGANWEVTLGSSAYWAIVSNQLRHNNTNPAGGSDGRMKLAAAALAARVGMVTQVTVGKQSASSTATVFPGVFSKWDGTDGYLFQIEQLGASQRPRLYRVEDGGTFSLLSSNSTFGWGAEDLILKLLAKPGVQNGWMLTAAGALTASNPATDTVLDAHSARAGLRGVTPSPTAEYHEYDEFAVYRDNTIVCTGLPTGYKLRVWTVAGASLTAVESGGTATIDLSHRHCPLRSVEVLTAADVIVHALTPSDGVWGGDEYAVGEEVLPAGPEISQVCRFASDAIEPNTGPEAGGTEVIIRGAQFDADATVTFGGSAATVTEVLESQITCTTPAGTGVVDVTVENPDGQSATLTDGFTYLGASPWDACPAAPETTWEQC